MIKLIIALLIPTSLFFNFYCQFKTLKKIDYLYGNYCAFQKRVPNSLSNDIDAFQIGYPYQIAHIKVAKAKKNEPVFLPNKEKVNDGYFIFSFAIGVLSIGIDIIIAKNFWLVKKKNHSLNLKNRLMLKQNIELQNALGILEENNAENTRMLQLVAHDLRSPMAAIVGLSGFMIDENKLASEDMEVISLIHRSGIDSLKFINEILEQGTAKIELQTIDLFPLLDYCITQLQFKAAEKQQHIILEGITCMMKVDREKVWKVITNLISNAIKFSPPKSIITVDMKVLIKKVVISIKDSGIGIPENLKDKIFTSCAQRKREGTSGEKSFGFGLAIAKQHVEAHGGSLNFKSKDGCGTTFFIELPIS